MSLDSDIEPDKSIEYDSSLEKIQLVNDESSPGNNRIYGTGPTGIKGWFDQGQFNGGINFGVETTISISSNTDDLSIPDIGTYVLIRLDVSGNRSLTGIIPSTTDVAWWIVVFNVGTGKLKLKDNDAGSTAQNRFLMNANKTVQNNEGIAFIYDPVTLRWRSFGINI